MLPNAQNVPLLINTAAKSVHQDTSYRIAAPSASITAAGTGYRIHRRMTAMTEIVESFGGR